MPQSKPITFAEYGFPTCDRCTNQPNVFYDPKSNESFTPYWSAWEPAEGGGVRPVRDDTLADLAREAIVEYWTLDGHNEASPAGIKMIEPALMCAWNWDARPFPVFPQSMVWGDSGSWRVGTWVGGKGPALPAALPDVSEFMIVGPLFPALAWQGWSVTYRPMSMTNTAEHASGRESRAGRNAAALWEIMMSFEVLTDLVRQDLQALVGFFAMAHGERSPFFVPIPPELGLTGGADFGRASAVVRQTVEVGLATDANVTTNEYGLASEPSRHIPCRFADEDLDVEGFATHLFAVQSLTLQMVRG